MFDMLIFSFIFGFCIDVYIVYNAMTVITTSLSHCRDTELPVLCPHVEVPVLPARPRHPRLPRPARPQVPALVVGVDITKPPEPGSWK